MQSIVQLLESTGIFRNPCNLSKHGEITQLNRNIQEPLKEGEKIVTDIRTNERNSRLLI